MDVFFSNKETETWWNQWVFQEKYDDFLTTSYSEKRPNGNTWKSSHKDTWHEMPMAIARKEIRSVSISTIYNIQHGPWPVASFLKKAF